MPSGDSPGMSPLNTAGTVESRAASAITVRSASDNPTNGARSTASQATRSSGDSSARASASRSRTTGTSASGSRFTPMNGTPRAPSAARIARRCPRAPASTATLSLRPRADQLGDQIAPPLRPPRAVRNRRATRYRLRLAFETGARGDAGKMPHRAAPHVVRVGKHPREHFVAPVHQRRCRAEIAPQLQRLQSDRAEAGAAHGREAADLGIAEPVDGLHRIAHQEQRASIAFRPVLRQRQQQVVLIARGVLEFVDQDVPDARAQPFGERRWRGILRERLARRAGHLGVIALALLVEDPRQLCRRQQQ